MKKKKQMLQELKVESFTTKINDSALKGGLTGVCVTLTKEIGEEIASLVLCE